MEESKRKQAYEERSSLMHHQHWPQDQLTEIPGLWSSALYSRWEDSPDGRGRNPGFTRQCTTESLPSVSLSIPLIYPVSLLSNLRELSHKRSHSFGFFLLSFSARVLLVLPADQILVASLGIKNFRWLLIATSTLGPPCRLPIFRAHLPLLLSHAMLFAWHGYSLKSTHSPRLGSSISSFGNFPQCPSLPQKLAWTLFYLWNSVVSDVSLMSLPIIALTIVADGTVLCPRIPCSF